MWRKPRQMGQASLWPSLCVVGRRCCLPSGLQDVIKFAQSTRDYVLLREDLVA